MGQHEHGTAGKPTVASVEEDKYDVKYVKLDISMSNVTTALGGNVMTTAKVTAPALTTYVFELEPPLVIDSVKVDGALCPYTSVGDVHTVSLPAPLSMGTLFTAQVYYHGIPVSGTNFSAKGINALRSPSWGNWATFTLSESYRAREWWPCKQSLTDKIDSSDIWITVDDSLKAGSNGVLQAVTHLGGGRDRYEWKERYPIDYYLISAAVGKYVDYSYYMHFTGSPDSMLIQNYVYDNPATLPNFKNVIDSTGIQVNFFSQYFGRYPFWKEKYGHCMGPLSGGMEHQTMSTMGFFESWLVAHELGHQWFGDNVTCATWQDIVMNEGFASYCEYMYLDAFRGHAVATADMVERQKNVLSELSGFIYVDDTTSEPRIFSSRLTYDKGACMVHTLRHVFNDDTRFFDLLRGWQTAMRDSVGTVVDLRELAKVMYGGEINGISLDTFFNQWVFGEGHPIYTATWNRIGNDVYVNLQQTTSKPSSVLPFKVPLELRLRSAAGDTTIRILNDQETQLLHFTWSKNMNGLAIDPNHWLIDSVTSITKDVTLGVEGVIANTISVQPNPSSTAWAIYGLPANCSITLTDMTGRALYATRNGSDTRREIPATTLAPGMYLLHVTNTSGSERVLKVVKE
ncbi:M1 family aminopeptidase [Nemorincola caseinilytica]|uniref:Aminopeptidase N n=2 Tax=Nemorincola caseinilytica TaxID=2054315 RepID=A0ABP8NAC4_9BACT